MYWLKDMIKVRLGQEQWVLHEIQRSFKCWFKYLPSVKICCQWCEFIKIFTLKMVWNDQDCYMANVQNWSTFLHGKCSESINIFTWQVVWVLQNFYMAKGLNWPWLLHEKWSKYITILTRQMVWIYQDFKILNGLNWWIFLHGKWSELIMNF